MSLRQAPRDWIWGEGLEGSVLVLPTAACQRPLPETRRTGGKQIVFSHSARDIRMLPVAIGQFDGPVNSTRGPGLGVLPSTRLPPDLLVSCSSSWQRLSAEQAQCISTSQDPIPPRK